MLRAFRLCFAIPVLWTVSIPAIAAQPFEGRWAQDPAWCTPNDEESLDERAITITARKIDIYVSWCRIDRVTKIGKRFRLQTMCREEGEEQAHPTSPETFTLTIKGDRMEIATKLASWDVQRCHGH